MTNVSLLNPEEKSEQQMEIILGLRISRNEFACYSGGKLLHRGLDSEGGEHQEEEGRVGVRKVQERGIGPSNKACFRTLWWKPVRSTLEGDNEEKEAERESTFLSLV